MDSTIFALSSGAPPAAIAILRVSGPHAGNALAALAGPLPEPRVASLRTLRDAAGAALDRAVVLWFPGPATVTGEDLAELHLHGGRAVIAAVGSALAGMPKLRRATAGEFTRRAFANGRIDLAEAEGLADLLSAETELQRASAIALASGQLSHQIESWRVRVLEASAMVEAAIDFADEDDVGGLPEDLFGRVADLRDELRRWLDRPRGELLRDGFRVVISGPPNAGKSTLFNGLVGSDAAITTPIAGTTRDVLTRSVAFAQIPFVFVDTAGLRDDPGEEIEAIGIARARDEAGRADLVLWLGLEGEGPEGAWEIAAQCDRPDFLDKRKPRHRVSATTGVGMAELIDDLVGTARGAMPRPGEVALNARQHDLIAEAEGALGDGLVETDILLIAENLRRTRVAFDALVGRSAIEDVLDALFGRFCLGK